MQIKLLFSLEEPLTIPLSYQYALQSLIYNILQTGNPSYSQFLHSKGYEGQNAPLKLFTFGRIYGESKAKQKHITFFHQIGFEIRCFHKDFCDSLISGLKRQNIWELNHSPIVLSDYRVTEAEITTNTVDIEMVSPLTCHMTIYEGEKKRTLYLNPLNHEIQSLINKNLQNKISAAFHAFSGEEVSLICKELTSSDKVVTLFKNKIYITAWYGHYILKGHPQVLSFLYNTGIGDRNSQGFGMFDVM